MFFRKVRIMKRFNTLKLTALTLLLGSTFATTTPAYADPGRGHGNSNHHKSEEHYRSYDNLKRDYSHLHADNIIIIDSSDRTVLRRYLNDDYSKKCPPGLAKKQNGCVPPGHAKYVIGKTLPRDVVYQPVPRYVLEQLGPVPAGYSYVRVDQDVLLIAEASKKIIDAVTLLSAVKN